MNIQIAKSSAEKFVSRAAWSRGDHPVYEWALMNLSTKEFKELTAHMHDQEGKIFKGDVGDPYLISLRRQLSQAEKEQADPRDIRALKGQVRRRERC